MNSSSDDRGRVPAIRIAGVGLGVLGAVGGIAGWFTLVGAEDGTAAGIGHTAGTVVAGSRSDRLGSGPVHTRTSGA